MGRSIHAFMPDRAVGAGMPLRGARRAVGNQRRQPAGPPGTMRELTTPQSGKQGTSVSYKSRHGQIRRQHVKPKNPRTPAQMRIRSNLGRTSARWRVLTDEQRAAWSRAARETRTRRRMGQATYLTGSQLFNKINAARAAIGLDAAACPAQPAEVRSEPCGRARHHQQRRSGCHQARSRPANPPRRLSSLALVLAAPGSRTPGTSSRSGCCPPPRAA